MRHWASLWRVSFRPFKLSPIEIHCAELLGIKYAKMCHFPRSIASLANIVKTMETHNAMQNLSFYLITATEQVILLGAVIKSKCVFIVILMEQVSSGCKNANTEM